MRVKFTFIDVMDLMFKGMQRPGVGVARVDCVAISQGLFKFNYGLFLCCAWDTAARTRTCQCLKKGLGYIKDFNAVLSDILEQFFLWVREEVY